ncbi:MAG TPA: isocitrate lyase/phosphoenolpyruvate mutase family protein [Micromonosporaceae bacterium]
MAAVMSAAALRSLHRPGEPLLLPNVWDAASARLVEAAGFPAVATSSAAVADVLGYADHEVTPVGEMLDAVARIVRAVPVPVTADLERGYALPPAELVERIAAAGAVGCNLEDSDPRTGTLIDPGRQSEFLAAVREAARDRDIDLVVNARIDTYLRGGGTPGERLAETVRRARRYLDAGVDCVYPIGVADRDAVGELVARIDGPVNVLYPALPPTTSIAELAALGVARISFGGRLYRASQPPLLAALAAIRDGGVPFPPDAAREAGSGYPGS